MIWALVWPVRSRSSKCVNKMTDRCHRHLGQAKESLEPKLALKERSDRLEMLLSLCRLISIACACRDLDGWPRETELGRSPSAVMLKVSPFLIITERIKWDIEGGDIPSGFKIFEGRTSIIVVPTPAVLVKGGGDCGT